MAKVVKSTSSLGFVWETADPFLFCVHHDDHYPAGDDAMGPAESLAGRNLGSDFTVKNGYRMYHGTKVPGFPKHPHRGFETITLVRSGLIDHSDSLGATARFGGGDCQWMTAGTGIEHCEMFPLVKRDAPNPLELFQIWINLPAKDKHVNPHFTMLWGPKIPNHALTDAAGRKVNLTTVAGEYNGTPNASPPPNSWASKTDHEVAIWSIKLDPGATFEIPAASKQANRRLYFFDGSSALIGGTKVESGNMVDVAKGVPVPLVNGDKAGEILMLQGRPIGEPVVQHGPFVMNTRQEIQECFVDYERGKFGKWAWPSNAPTHPREKGRFAVHVGGVEESAPPL